MTFQSSAKLSRRFISPDNDHQVVFGLLELVKPAGTQQNLLPCLWRFIVDISGSTSGPSAPGSSESILDVEKAGIISVARRMRDEHLASLVGFEDTMHVLMATTNMKIARQQFIDAVDELTPLKNTNLSTLSTSLTRSIASVPGTLVEGFLTTDGHINAGGANPQANCVRTMKKATDVRFTIVGIGENYDPDFLTELAEAGPAGSSYQHVSSAGELQRVLEERLAVIQSMGDVTDVEIRLTGLNGVTIENTSRLVPDYKAVPNTSPTEVGYSHGALDVQGQRMVWQLNIPARTLFAKVLREAEHDVLRWEITYKNRTVPAQPMIGTLSLVITEDRVKVMADDDDDVVMQTAYTARGTMYTRTGNLGAAQTMFTQAGMTAVAKGLSTLSAGGMGENERRTLMTQINLSGRKAPKNLSS
jgi:hypothetical protein